MDEVLGEVDTVVQEEVYGCSIYSDGLPLQIVQASLEEHLVKDEVNVSTIKRRGIGRGTVTRGKPTRLRKVARYLEKNKLAWPLRSKRV